MPPFAKPPWAARWRAASLPASLTHKATTGPSWPLTSVYLTSRTTSHAPHATGDATSTSPAAVLMVLIEVEVRSLESLSRSVFTQRSVAIFQKYKYPLSSPMINSKCEGSHCNAVNRHLCSLRTMGLNVGRRVRAM